MQLGTNLTNPTYFGPAIPFSDLMRHCGCGAGPSNPWTIGGKNPAADAQGYPILRPGQVATTVLGSNIGGHYPGGSYICRWKGTGTIAVSRDATDAGPGPSANSRLVTVAPSGHGVWIQITRSDPTDNVRDISLLPAAAHAAPLFSPRYLSGFGPYSGALRMMDWNTILNYPVDGILRWQDRVTPDYCSQAWIPSPLLDASGNPVVDPATGRACLRGGGVAIEHQVALANALKRDLWFHIPHGASEDYASGAAALISGKLYPGLLCFVEVGNENWNGGYPTTAYCKELGLAAGSGTPIMTGHAILANRLFRAFDAGWGPDDSRVRRVLADQGPSRVDTVMGFLQGLGYGKIDAFSVNSYMDPNPSAYTASTTAAQVLADLAASLAAKVVPNMTALKALCGTWSERLGRPILCTSYEGGEELIGKGQPYQPAYFAAHADPGMGDLYRRYLPAMATAGLDLLVHFVDLGAPSQFGCYGTRDFVDSDWTSPKAAALAAWAP